MMWKVWVARGEKGNCMKKEIYWKARHSRKCLLQIGCSSSQNKISDNEAVDILSSF